MIEPNFEKNKYLFLLIKKYKELLKDKSVFIEDQIYIKILDTIGDIIEGLKNIEEIDINRLEQLTNFYKKILERYHTIYPEDINIELDNLNNSIKSQIMKEPITLIWNKNTVNNRINDETTKLANDIDIIIGYVNEIIKIVEKYYEFNKYDAIKEKRQNTETEEIIPAKDIIVKPSFFWKLLFTIKKFLRINRYDIVVDSPYIEIDSEKEFRKKYLTKKSEIYLQHIPKEEIKDYIDGKNEIFDKIDNLFYGLSNPREVILENDDDYYYLEDDDVAYIIADKNNTELETYKNTDTIICSDDNQYFRIVSDNTTLIYEEYKAKSYLNNNGLFIRSPLDRKTGREYIKYKEKENGTITEYFFEEERNGTCSINIHSTKNAREDINMLYDSKSDIVSKKRPRKVTLSNILKKHEFERNKRNKYKSKNFIYQMGEGEWCELCSFNKSYRYNQIFNEFGSVVETIDLDIVNLDIIRNGIKAAIPDKIMQIYSKIHPEIAMMIKDYGKEQEEKVDSERN